MINKKIILLSDFLRKEGMIVSIRSTITASSIYNKYGDLFTIDELKESLKSIYVKNNDDYPKFESVFDKIFIKSEKEFKKKKERMQSRNESGVTESSNTKQQDEVLSEREMIDDLVKTRQESVIINQKLSNDSFNDLNVYDFRVYDICKQLSKKIANRRSKRKKIHKSNKIDMRRTIRYNLKNGGHLIKIATHRPPLRKTKQIFLCDISGSCEWASSWFFAILHGCQHTFEKIYVYDFDNRIIDITPLFEEEYNNLYEINMAHKALGVRSYGQSNMNTAFEEFLESVPLNSKTDIIILTDCRDWKGEIKDGILTSATLVRKMAQQARKVIILNPEKKIRWNNATSYVSDYEKAGAKVFETNTLNQLADVVSKL